MFLKLVMYRNTYGNIARCVYAVSGLELPHESASYNAIARPGRWIVVSSVRHMKFERKCYENGTSDSESELWRVRVRSRPPYGVRL